MNDQNAYTTQQVVHTEFRVLQQLGCEVTLPTPMGWLDICRRRLTLRQQLQRDPLHRLQQATRADALAFLTHQFAATHIRDALTHVNLCATPKQKELAEAHKTLTANIVQELVAGSKKEHVLQTEFDTLVEDQGEDETKLEAKDWFPNGSLQSLGLGDSGPDLGSDRASGQIGHKDGVLVCCENAERVQKEYRDSVTVATQRPAKNAMATERAKTTAKQEGSQARVKVRAKASPSAE